MNILFDNIIFSLQNSGGISVFWYEMIKRLLKDYSQECFYIDTRKSMKNIFRKQLNIPEDRIFYQKDYLINILRYHNPFVKNKNRVIFHSSYYRTCTNKKAVNITTVHDFNYENLKCGPSRWVHSIQKFNAINRSDKIICISFTTKKDLCKYLPHIDESNVSVIFNGVSEDFFEIPGTIKNEFVLYVGRREKYKHFDILVDAVSRTDLKLCMIGGGKLSNNEQKYLFDRIGDKRFIHLTSVTNAELNRYYNNAFCLVYPSGHEGFGIPVIEAQRAGCPVIAYNGTSVSEITDGNSALLYDNHSPEDIVAKIERLYDVATRNKIVEYGKFNSLKYSWDNTFKNYLNVYKMYI